MAGLQLCPPTLTGLLQLRYSEMRIGEDSLAPMVTRWACASVYGCATVQANKQTRADRALVM